MNINRTFLFLVTVSLLCGCSNNGDDDNGAAAVSEANVDVDGREYTVCECVNEPIRSSEKAKACGKLAETVPDYVSQVMACKGETVPEVLP